VKRAIRQFLVTALGLCGVVVTASAQASVALCVTARTEAAEQAGFEKLVRSEVERHPSHRIAEKDCESRLVVEVFRTEGTRYLTVQLDGEVPDRATLAKPEELAQKLSDAVTAVLGNDPMYLAKDPDKYSAMERASRSVLVRGMNTYRLELFETLMRTDKNIAFAPGLAIGFARGADQWQVQARLHLAGSPSAISGTERALRVAAGMDAGVIYEASRRAPTSGYVGTGVGLALYRVEGLVDASDPNSAAVVDTVGATVHLRAGVRFLRIFDFDADAFVQANLPLFTTKETDNLLFGDSGIYTPSLQIGMGVGF